MSAVADRVAAGAAFLDEHDPQWWRADVERAIDLGLLNLENGQLCVLGQRCPLEARPPDEGPGDNYAAYASRLSGYPVSKFFTIDRWASQFGFQAGDDGLDTDDEFAALTAEWKRVITERRSAS